jgi:uncharacterized membrane protein YhaH (DUF805 family)
MFTIPFSFYGRIRRTEYGLSFIIYIVACIAMAFIQTVVPYFVVLYIPIVWFLWAQGAKRCHDRGNSGWFQIIPFYVLWLLFAEGDKGNNGFGDDPKNPGLIEQVVGQGDILDSNIRL